MKFQLCLLNNLFASGTVARVFVFTPLYLSLLTKTILKAGAENVVNCIGTKPRQI